MNETTVLFESKKDMEEVLEINKIRQLRINDELFCIVRTQSNVFVFEKTCPHMDYPLIDAHVNHQEEVSCPWHGYRFSLTTGDESQNRCRALHQLQTRWNESGQLVLDL